MRSIVLGLGLLFVASSGCGAADVGAQPRDRPLPQPPASAPDVNGHVKMRFDVEPDGRTANLAVLESSPAGVFDKAASDAVAQWTYSPRRVDGRAIIDPGHIVMLNFERDTAPSLVVHQDTLPGLTVRVAATLYYPRAAYEKKVEGKVVLGFDIDDRGRPTQPRVVSSMPLGVFDTSALEYLKDLRFYSKAQTDLTINIPFQLAGAQLKPVHDRLVVPEFPDHAADDNVVGECSVGYWIEPSGTVSDPEVVYCLPSGYFEDASLVAVRKWTFKPESNPALNSRRRETVMFDYGLADAQKSGIRVSYLKPGQWVRLQYTLTKKGLARDVRVVARSQAGLSTWRAVAQLQQSTFTPVVEAGQPVEKPGLLVEISADP